MLLTVNSATVLALNRLNQRFYAAIAAEWSDTRKSPWNGFARLLARLPTTPPNAPARVLDVGAGDGRFAAYLANAAQRPIDYLGLDACPALLRYAQERKLGSAYRFAHCDFIADDPALALPTGYWDLIALLGVLHHVPSLALRKRLLAALAARMSEDAVLALTFWRLPDDERFARRTLSWESYNASAMEPIDLSELEPGDVLLHWGDAVAPPRYCHFPNEPEIDTLLAACPLRVLERFRADGRGARLNDYLLLTNAPLSR